MGFQGKRDRVQWWKGLNGNNGTGRVQWDVETEQRWENGDETVF